MIKPLCKNLKNVDRNTTGKFGVCKCCWSEVFASEYEKKPILRKRPLKNWHQPMRFRKLTKIS